MHRLFRESPVAPANPRLQNRIRRTKPRLLRNIWCRSCNVSIGFGCWHFWFSRRVRSGAAETQADAIAALQKRGVRVDKIEPTSSEKFEPFFNVYYHAADLTDADFQHLPAIGPVRMLDIRSPEVGDAALRKSRS